MNRKSTLEEDTTIVQIERKVVTIFSVSTVTPNSQDGLFLKECPELNTLLKNGWCIEKEIPVAQDTFEKPDVDDLCQMATIMIILRREVEQVNIK